MREAARTCFDESEAGQALIAEHRQGNAERAAVHDRVKRAKTIAYSDPMFRLERFLQRHVAEENFNRGIPAVEERRAMFAGFIAADREAVGSLELDPAIEAPAYTAQTDWHPIGTARGRERAGQTEEH